MSFLTPLYLAGAALIALPVVLHLLRRDVAPEVPFTAVRLLRRTPVERSRKRRLRDLLLLAARVAALLLLAAAFARPYVRGAPGKGRATVVAVDRSFSMTAPGVFANALQHARAAVDAAGPRVAVVAFDDRADVVAAMGSAADARAALAGLKPGFGATRYAAALDKAADLLRDEPNGRLVLISDLQRSGFDGASAILPDSIALDARDAGGTTGNLAVTDLRIQRDQAIAVVRNYGPIDVATDARADSGGAVLGSRRVMIPAREAAEVAFSRADLAQGITVSIDDRGGYAADDQRFAAPSTRVLPRVLIAAGGPVPTAGYYLSRALLASGDRGPEFDVGTVSGNALAALSAGEITQQAVIALLSTHGLDRRVKGTLRAFLDAGGGLLIAAAPDVDASVLSALLDWQPALAPRDLTDAGVLAVSDLRHPIFRPFDALGANFAQVAFQRAWGIDPGSAWRVIARYSGGAVALAERSAGRGRILLFTSDMDHRWNDFPLHPSFVPFAQEAVRYLGAQAPQPLGYLVDEVPAGVLPRPGIVRTGARTMAVNVDPRESSIERLAPAAFVEQVTRTAASEAIPTRARAEQTETRQGYWRYGLMLMLVALIGEAFVGSR